MALMLLKKITNDLANIDDDIFKIAIYDFSNALNNSYKISSPLFSKDYNVSILQI